MTTDEGIYLEDGDWRVRVLVVEDAPNPMDEFDEPSAQDYAAYLAGEVYWYIVEHRVDVSATVYDELIEWEHVDSCGGFYGDEWALENAREAFYYAMLPVSA